MFQKVIRNGQDLFYAGRPIVVVSTVILLLVGLIPVTHAQEGTIVVTPINGRFFMISTNQPNDSTVLLYVGDDSALLVDSHFAFNTSAIQSAVADITNLPLRYVINTHWHPDHTDGNAAFRENGALVFAHETVRSRMAAGQMIELFQFEVAPYPKAALPDVTFDNRLTLHLIGQEIQVMHAGPAHTDGDAVVFFPQSNIVHMGDLFTPVIYPFMDVSSGGGVDGYVAMLDQVLGMIDESTVVVPGHGPLSTTPDLRAYRDMFVTFRDHVQAGIQDGKTLDEILAGSPTSEFDARYNNPPLTYDVFVSTLYDLLSAQARADGAGQ